MFDDRFVTTLATEIAARITDQIRDRSGRAQPRLLTVKEAATYLGRSEQALQHLIHKRDIAVVRRGRRVHLDRTDLDRWIEKNKI